MPDEKKISPPLTAEQLQEKLRSGNYKIEMADTTEVDKAEKGVDRVLKAIGSIMAPDDEEWADCVFVSDESTIGDFLSKPEELAELSEKLGSKVTKQTYIRDIAVTI